MSKERPKSKKIELNYRDEWPICPHCGKEIEEVLGISARRGLAILYCPHCRKVLAATTLF